MKSLDPILDRINSEGISIIIGARNEYPQIAMTISSLIEDMHTSGINKWEVIIMDNGSEDDTTRFFAWKRAENTNTASERSGRPTISYSPRGLVNEGRLRMFFDPIMSNVGTRNKGVLHAKYENIIFSDAHITIRPGTIKSVVTTLIEHGGIVHAPIAWMGASPENNQAGYQYSYKVGEKIWGTWNKCKVTDSPFYIPICGHAFLAVNRTKFLEYRGYPLAQRVYGGGEPYLDTKYWMLGSTSMMDPNALVYHLSAGRGYNFNSNDLLHNMLLVSYILGGEKWLDRITITYLNKPGINEAYFNLLRSEAIRDGKEDKDWLDKNRIKTFEQVLGLDHEEELRGMSEKEISELKEDWYCTKCTKRGYSDPHVMRSWDYANENLHKTHRSWVQEFALVKNDKGVFIGNTQITDPRALNIAKKYL